MRPILQRSLERRRTSTSLVDPCSQNRRSSLPGAYHALGVPDTMSRRSSWNGSLLGCVEERRASYTGSYSAETYVTRPRRKQSLMSDPNKDKCLYNPCHEKLSNRCVLKVVGGMTFLVILVFLVSIYRFIT